MAWEFVRVIPFRDLPTGARRLILYYSIGEPSVVGFVIFNAYLFLMGYSPLYVGSIISGASLITALILPLLGYLSDRKINAKYYLIASETLIGTSFLLYGFAQNEWWIFIGRVIFSSAMLFSFTYSVYEKELYPHEIMEDAYVWHWIIPSIAGMVTYIAAFLYFSIFSSVSAARIYYIVLGFLAPLFISYVYFALPDIPTYHPEEKIKIPRELFGVVLVYILSYLATYFLYGITLDNIIINYFGSGIAIIVLVAFIESVFGFTSSTIKAHIPRKYFPVMPYLAMSTIGIVSLILFTTYIIKIEGLTLFIAFYSIIYLMWPLWHMSFKPLLQKRIPKEYRGTIFSSIQSLMRLINIPLALVLGAIIVIWGSFSPLLISFFFSILTVITLKIL